MLPPLLHYHLKEVRLHIFTYFQGKPMPKVDRLAVVLGFDLFFMNYLKVFKTVASNKLQILGENQVSIFLNLHHYFTKNSSDTDHGQN
jgi:hypothetical protein